MTGIVADWHGGWARYRGRLAAVPATRNAPAVAGVVLGLAALAEAVARGLIGHLSVVGVLTAAILALCTTVPLAFLGPAPAAVCIVVAGVLSLTAFRLLTVAGLAATLIALYLLGRDGWSAGGTGRISGQWLAPVLAGPFLIVALTGARSPGSEQQVLAVLLAALAPAAALAGIAQRARIQARMHIAARQVCRELSPDVVLMDVRMPVMDGIEATRQLAGPGPDGNPGPRILILTTFDLDHYVYDALCAGASGFLLKDVTAERLFDAVRVVAVGEALLAPAVTRRLISEFARLRPRPDATPAAALSTLTPRETQVLRLVAEGLSNTEIAARLVVTEETVKTHVSRVLSKLGLRDRTQAVVTAYETGLVVPGFRAPG